MRVRQDEIAPKKTLDSDSRGTSDNQLRRNPLARSAVNGVATQRGEREREREREGKGSKCHMCSALGWPACTYYLPFAEGSRTADGTSMDRF